MEHKWLSEVEQQAWRSLLRSCTRLLSQLDRDLESSEGLSLAEFDVLVVLSEGAPEGVRMTALAERSLLSKSRLSHCVDRLEKRGFVRREPSNNDRRGLLAVLTDEGFARIQQVSPTHLSSARRYVVDVLSPEELEQAGAIGARIFAALEQHNSRN